MSGIRRHRPYNPAAIHGRPIRVPVGAGTVRAVLKRHFREERVPLSELAKVWQCNVDSVYGTFWRKTPLPPQYVDAAIELLGLDEFDAAELRLLGAREAGWNIEPKHLLEPGNG